MKERFDAKWIPEPNSGCWLWIATNRGGYGRVKFRGRLCEAHRVSWVLYRGDLPDNLDIDHKCRNRCCVNPDHLEPVSHRINVLRGVAPTAVNAAKTRCVNGHEFSRENTIETVSAAGTVYRKCRECGRKRSREYMRRRYGYGKPKNRSAG